MKLDVYNQYDATGLARLNKQGEVKALDLIELAISQMDRHNPELNATIATDFERARSFTSRKDQSTPLLWCALSGKKFEYLDGRSACNKR